ncbi:MAG: hypothetical protein IPL27_01175 [Lewinellaceae bacterium]|nr:hypothetical protein [Lewinellaceae bacterium]
MSSQRLDLTAVIGVSLRLKKQNSIWRKMEREIEAELLPEIKSKTPF